MKSVTSFIPLILEKRVSKLITTATYPSFVLKTDVQESSNVAEFYQDHKTVFYLSITCHLPGLSILGQQINPSYCIVIE